MLKNYFKIAYRNLYNQKGFSLINIIGLAIGMTCCLLIFQYVAFEYSYDKFHDNKDHVYRVLQAYAKEGEPMGSGHAFTAQALAPALKSNVPEIKNIARVGTENAIVTNAENPERVFEEDGILFVDEAFVKMFTFPFAKTESHQPLTSGNAFITERTARKYFGDEPAEGKILEVAGEIQKAFTVAGVLKDVPVNSHLQFDILLPITDLLNGDGYATEPEGGWSWNNFVTYVQVEPKAEVKSLEKKMTDVYLKHRGEINKQQGWAIVLQAQRLTDVHLNAEVMGVGNKAAGNYRTVYFFLVVGVITLVIALVNYINLATARAVNRSREVGVRKAVGAIREQLIMQFLAESAITNVVAALLAFALATALIPVVNDVAETHLSIQLWLDPSFWMAFGVTMIVTTLMAGLYPAFVLSSFKPASVLKGRSSYVASHLWLRRALVVIQFAASIVLLAGTAIVYKQLNYMRTMDLGLSLDRVVTIQAPRVMPENADRATVMRSFIQEIQTLNGVDKGALSTTVPGTGFNWNGASMRKATDDPARAIQGVATFIDTTFASIYGLKLVAGKDFSQVSDDTVIWQVILNKTGVASLGFASEEEAIGEALDIGGNASRIIGVYEDFNWTSAHQTRQNIIFGLATEGSVISVKVQSADVAAVIANVQRVYNEMFPGNVFAYEFADQAFDRQYRDEQRFAKLFTIAAGMAIFIACLGLFGLVAFTAQQRTKEIGMRKVLGATIGSIVGLLSKDFLKLVGVGYVIAIPLTWYVMTGWLENFAYRTEVGVGIFLAAGFIALIIAIATVSWQSFKAAVANPVKSLRDQ
ncbi:MAG TPA: ABC transporter permease [Chryseosolibacter sp.]|nr:ABC transporter permease [Chryseosolibacter sp.]